MKKKSDTQVLQEVLKRFKLISEYSFYTEEPNKDDNLLLGNMDEADEEPADPNAAPPVDPAAGADPNAATAPAAGTDPNAIPPAPTDDSNTSAGAAPPPSAPAPDMGIDAMNDIPEDDAVDVDVTELVDSTEDAKHAADIASHKTSKLMQKFSDLEGKLDNMAALSNKIDAIEKEIVKRNPTPNEKLEMRSLDSGPFNIKLSDYWKDVEGYDTGSEPKEKEYVLTKDDVDGGFLDGEVKNSFNIPDDDEYEEEEI